jgi:ABC-2 type transport system permease protein
MAWHDQPAYLRVFWTIVRNSLVRDLSFRSNFAIECLSSVSWVLMNLGFYLLIFQYTSEIGRGSGWGKFEFFVFLATTMFINSIVQAFFMPNAQEFSELIRTGNLDFALLKPIDTQFLVSLHRVEWSALANFVVGLILVTYSLVQLTTRAVHPLVLHPLSLALYPFYVVCGIAILYGLMITLAATSIWLGRNQSLYDFWFYITNFSRYPMEIYGGPFGTPLRMVFTFVIPVLVVVNVPARLLALPLRWNDPLAWWLPIFAVIATAGSLLGSRYVFLRALVSYRSASS